MNNIKLHNKRTEKTLDCDIHLGDYPQIVEVEIIGGETISYSSLEELVSDWEIVLEVKEK